ncbi:MAG: DMT family transporter [Pseudomonadales bacterium]|nr:DMT family transporter [Pseudomonadales bacterium]
MLSGKTIFLTIIAMIAFAANSLLCRLALMSGEIDPASFTVVRLVSGAFLLGAIVYSRCPKPCFEPRRVMPALMLFIYAAAFSFAYLSLSAGTGALILFGSVQATMLTWAFLTGEKPNSLQVVGCMMAIGGLVYLVLPGVTAPSFTGSVLMAAAGFAWGVYTLLGKSANDPLTDTANNFIKTLPVLFIVWLLLLIGEYPLLSLPLPSVGGVALAVASGALSSGLGYAIWYSVVPALSSTQAASVQLSVPVIAGVGGVLFMSEEMSMRLAIAGIFILGGIACTLMRLSR